MVFSYTNSDSNSYHQESSFLSQNDVDCLLADTSADSRITVLTKISKQYNEGEFHERELQLAEQIFRVLMKDTEVRVRQTLAEQLKLSESIPRDVILHLAQDAEMVSLPVLKSSKILSDADLINIIETSREVTKLLAISQRERVSSRVSSALIETSYPQVVTSLLGNQGSQIPDNVFGDILSEFSENDSVLSALVERANLPLATVENLIGHVTSHVAEELERKYKLSTRDAKTAHARESVTLSALGQHRPDDEIEIMITQMMAQDRLTPSLILSSLCKGHLSFFEIALAKIAGIPKPNARKLIHDKGLLGFKAIYSKTDLPESMFDAVQLVLMAVKEMQGSGMRPDSYGFSGALVDKVLSKTQGKHIDNLPYIIALIRQS